MRQELPGRKECSYRTFAYFALSFFEDRDVGVELASCSLGKDYEGFEKYLLLPAKNLRRERRAHEKHQGQCCQVAQVRPPRVTLPNPFEQ
jgi:hypothetical protein